MTCDAGGGRYPPRSLLRSVQSTAFLEEYIEVGKASAALVQEWTGDDSEPLRVLDFGCGCARTINFITSERWQLLGCDVNTEAIEWCKKSFPQVDFLVNGHSPPLPFQSSSFDVVYAISIFTHLDITRQRQWFQELRRILREEGILLVTTLGKEVAGATVGPKYERVLEKDGFVFRPEGTTFNRNAAFHTPQGVEALVSRWFAIDRYEPLALRGYQDAYLLRPHAPGD